MSRFTPSLCLSLRAAAIALAALVVPAVLRAQTTTAPKVFYACYVPSSGSVYRIKEVDLKQECAKSTHVQFSWTDGAGHLSETFTVTSPTQSVTAVSGQLLYEQSCPAGSQLVGGGFRVLGWSNSFPLITRSTPSDDGTGWAVNVMPGPFGGAASFTVWARCAK